MKRSNRLILLIGVFLAIVAFVGIVVVVGRPTSSGPGGPQQPATELPTVIAKQDIPLGTPLRADMLETKQLPVTARETTAFQDTSLVVGRTVRTNLAAGKQLSEADFASSAAAQELTVPEGQRAVAIEIDLETGVGKLLQPGDYVDLVLAIGGENFTITTIDPDTGEEVASQTGLNTLSSKLIVQGMQILGIVENAPAPVVEGETAPGPTASPATVVLSVSPQQAELIKWFQSTSLIANSMVQSPYTLVLRAPCVDDQGNATVCDVAPTTGITLRSLVDEYDLLIPQIIEAIQPGQ